MASSGSTSRASVRTRCRAPISTAAASPTSSKQVASEYDAVLGFYRDELGFHEPLRDDFVRGDNGGDDRFDVYLLDFPTSADGSFRHDACLPDAPSRCAGHMLHENDFNGRSYPSTQLATRILASHELFHAVQAAYTIDAGVVLGEGTATWASEAYDAALPDFEAIAPGYFDRPERSLAQEPTGPVDAFSYGSAIFFRYLEERFDAEVIRELWEALEQGDGGDGATWPAALDALLAERHDSSLAEAFAQFAEWNLYTADRADAAIAYSGAPTIRPSPSTRPPFPIATIKCASSRSPRATSSPRRKSRARSASSWSRARAPTPISTAYTSSSRAKQATASKRSRGQTPPIRPAAPSRRERRAHPRRRREHQARWREPAPRALLRIRSGRRRLSRRAARRGGRSPRCSSASRWRQRLGAAVIGRRLRLRTAFAAVRHRSGCCS